VTIEVEVYLLVSCAEILGVANNYNPFITLMVGLCHSTSPEVGLKNKVLL